MSGTTIIAQISMSLSTKRSSGHRRSFQLRFRLVVYCRANQE